MSWSKQECLALIRTTHIMPVIRVSSREHAMCAVEGLIDGGIPIAEVTLTIPGALSIIESLISHYGKQLLVGAGTVLDAESCRQAVLSGAEFVVSPAFNAGMVEVAKEHRKVCIPGALSPTEVLIAWQAGADLVKIFPCGAVGGPKYISALKGPFPEIEFVATAGVSLESIPQFIAAGVTAVGVGEKIFELEALRQGDVSAISRNAQRFVNAVASVRAAATSPA